MAPQERAVIELLIFYMENAAVMDTDLVLTILQGVLEWGGEGGRSQSTV